MTGREPVIYTILNLTKDHDDYLEPEPEARPEGARAVR